MGTANAFENRVLLFKGIRCTCTQLKCHAFAARFEAQRSGLWEAAIAALLAQTTKSKEERIQAAKDH